MCSPLPNSGADREFALSVDKLRSYQFLPVIKVPGEQLMLGAHPQTSLLAMPSR